VSVPAVEIAAPAKANLFLRVLGREADGYHAIETLFCRLDLADTLRAERREGQGVTIAVSGAEVGPPDANLAVRAAHAVLDAVEHRFAVHLTLAKRIPVSAGLGGGSADAAAALLAVNRLADDAIPRHELLQFAARLGSDVPFCLSGAPLALGWGRGERLLRLPGLPAAPGLVVSPSIAIATAEAYRWVDAAREWLGAAGRWRSTSTPSPAGATSPGWRATTSSRRSSRGTPRSARPSRRWWPPTPWCAE